MTDAPQPAPEGYTREEYELLSHYAFAAMARAVNRLMPPGDTDNNFDATKDALCVVLAPGEQVEDIWRAHTGVRVLYREMTGELLTRLREVGFVIKPPKTQKIDDQLELVMTIPARKAYTL